MRISRHQLKKLVESFLSEKKSTTKVKCPKCGTVNEAGIDKCKNCKHDYDSKFDGRSWTEVKNENRLYHLFEQAAKFICPKPAKSVELNTVNRDRGIKASHIKYGPLNLNDEDYWKEYAKKWGTTAEVAKKSNCGNCVAFDISPQMKDCMPGDTSDGEGHLGYCWMHHFKCHSARTCNTWAKGGPIKEDEKSTDWFEGAKDAALFNRSHKKYLERKENE